MNLKTEAFQTKKRGNFGPGPNRGNPMFQLGKVKKSQVPEGTKD